MEIAKCSNCLKEVSEVGNTYYETWEKKKVDFGLAGEKAFFCQNCWKEKEKSYRDYPEDNDQLKRGITKNEITEKTSTGFTCLGDYICYDPARKEWVKEEELTSVNPENKPTEKRNDKQIIWVILIVVLTALLFFIGYLWKNRKKG